MTDDIPAKKGFFSHIEQILSDINVSSDFKLKITLTHIGVENEVKIKERIAIIENAIDYYKNHLPINQLEQSKKMNTQQDIAIEFLKHLVLQPKEQEVTTNYALQKDLSPKAINDIIKHLNEIGLIKVNVNLPKNAILVEATAKGKGFLEKPYDIFNTNHVMIDNSKNENYHNAIVAKGDNISQSGINQVSDLSVLGNHLDNAISVNLSPNDQAKQPQNAAQNTSEGNKDTILKKIYKWTDHKLISMIIYGIVAFILGLIVKKYFNL